MPNHFDPDVFTLADRHRGIVLGLDEPQAQRVIAYFFSPSAGRGRTATLRRRVVALYDPFADRRQFPCGLRYCINVYAGCPHVHDFLMAPLGEACHQRGLRFQHCKANLLGIK